MGPSMYCYRETFRPCVLGAAGQMEQGGGTLPRTACTLLALGLSGHRDSSLEWEIGEFQKL